jgi:hypothetical protein
MTTFLVDKCQEIRNWLAIGPEVYPDPVIIGWIRMAEEYLSTALRVKHMIQIDTCNLVEKKAALPADWQEIRMVRRADTGGILRYQTPDAFFNPEYSDPPDSAYPGQLGKYCILGNFIVVGGVNFPPSLKVELTYYQNIPPLTDEVNNWPNAFHQTVYTLKILHVASLYAIEDDRGPMWDQEVVRMVNGMNAQHKMDMASGTVLTQTRRKTFG